MSYRGDYAISICTALQHAAGRRAARAIPLVRITTGLLVIPHGAQKHSG